MTKPFDPWHGLPPGKPEIPWEGLPPPGGVKDPPDDGGPVAPPPSIDESYMLRHNIYRKPEKKGDLDNPDLWGAPILEHEQYRPYSTDSGTVPLKRKLTPEEFGQVPAPPISLDPPRPPPDIWIDPIYVKGVNNGGYLNKGISQLPMNGQGDTLTTQVFQSGFRPRR